MQPLSATMTATSRKRRFIILLVICCVSFFVFGWYMRTEEEVSLPEIPLAEYVHNPRTSNNAFQKESLGPSNTGGESPRSNTTHVKKPYNKFKTDEKISHINTVKAISQSGHDLKLVSNSSKFAEEVTFLSVAHVTKLPPSGPTELPASGPTELPASGPTELESSGPTELPPSGPTELEPSGPTELPPSGPTELEPSGPTELPPSGPTELEPSGPTELPPSGPTDLPASGPTDVQPVRIVTKPAKNHALILDTPACKVPKLNPFDPTVVHLYEKQEPYKCPGPPLFMKSQPDGSIALSEKILKKYYNMKREELACTYKAIHRKHEDEGNVRENDYTVDEALELKLDEPLNEDYVAVQCKLKTGKKFEQYFPLVRLRENIEKERSSITPPEPRLNIILAGIDSISNLIS